MSEERPQGMEADESEVPLCPGCMTENDPAADFCVKCGQPLSAIATIDPFRRTLSQGHWFRSAASGRISPIVFWGTWLVFLPAIIGMALGVAGSVFSGDLMYAGAAGIIGAILIAGLALAGTILLWRMTRNYRAAGCAENDRDE